MDWLGRCQTANICQSVQKFVLNSASLSVCMLVKNGGSISAEHGIGFNKTNLMYASKATQNMVTMRALKDYFDPKVSTN